MIVAPAVDLRGGRCVQLVGGVPGSEQVSLPDPVQIALKWRDLGFGTLHIVDLDAALGDGDNQELIREILKATDATTQVGGGLRSDGAVAAVFELGADRAVVGTRAVEEPEWAAALAQRHPGRIVVAADIRDGQVLTRGWQEASALRIGDFLDAVAEWPLAGILVTDVGREGRLGGIDPEQTRAIVESTAHAVWISGGVTDHRDLTTLVEVGAHGAVVGMALYQEKINANEIAEEYGA